MTYHPGKVIAVIPGDETQATLEMWDDNTLTMLVDKAIAGKIKEGDVVLADYRPYSDHVSMPRQVIVKILSKATAEKVMNAYEEYFEKRRGTETTPQKVGYG